MPFKCSKWESNRPDGPAPTIPTWVFLLIGRTPFPEKVQRLKVEVQRFEVQGSEVLRFKG
jgi:hypothetical protein